MFVRGGSRHAATNQNADRLFPRATACARQKRKDQQPKPTPAFVASGFSHISPRPLQPGQDAQMLETFKKTSPYR